MCREFIRAFGFKGEEKRPTSGPADWGEEKNRPPTESDDLLAMGERRYWRSWESS